MLRLSGAFDHQLANTTVLCVVQSYVKEKIAFLQNKSVFPKHTVCAYKNKIQLSRLVFARNINER